MLFYEIFGSLSITYPTPLVFLHGFLGSHLDWIPLIEKLQDRYMCIAIDLPAHGKSSYAEDVFSSVEKTLLSLATIPILIGYSLGGRIAFDYGKKHPEKIKSLIALSSHTGLKTAEEKEKRKISDLLWQARLENLSPQEFLTLWYKQPIFSSLQEKPELLHKLLEMRAYKNPKELSQVFNQVSLANQPLYENFKHPTYFLFGEKDTSYVKLYNTHPLEIKKEIKKAGHAVHLENPLECLEAVDYFISKKSLIPFTCIRTVL